MFDFAIASSKKRKPSKRLYISWVASCIVHGLALLVLIQFPQLLQGGMYHHFRPGTFLEELISPKSSNELRNDRIVTVLKPMTAPSEATLKKYLYDWNKKDGSAPPVQLRWGKEQLEEILSDNKPPVQKPKQELPQPAPPVSVSPAAPQVSGAAGGGSPSDSSSSGTFVVSVQNDPNRKGTVNFPPPAPAGSGSNEVASNTAPSSIPNSIKPPSNTAASAPKGQNGSENMGVFENEQQAIRSPQGGFWTPGVPKGFPLGDYTQMIIERIKGKWYIPSNLRNSQGHTTVIFFIDKQGHFTDARIVGSSGSNSLDFAALNAIIESNPAPPLPKGFPGDRVGAKFIFSYNEPQ
jgi:TonB family protein